MQEIGRSRNWFLCRSLLGFGEALGYYLGGDGGYGYLVQRGDSGLYI